MENTADSFRRTKEDRQPKISLCEGQHLTLSFNDTVFFFSPFFFPYVFIRAQLFEGRLALNPGLNLTRVSFSYVQKHFFG